MDITSLWGIGSTAVSGILLYILKDRYDKYNRLEQRVTHLELTQAVQDESSKHVNSRMDSMDKKLDRLLEIMGDKS